MGSVIQEGLLIIKGKGSSARDVWGRLRICWVFCRCDETVHDVNGVPTMRLIVRNQSHGRHTVFQTGLSKFYEWIANDVHIHSLSIGG